MSDNEKDSNLREAKTLAKDVREVKSFMVKTTELNTLFRDNIFEAVDIFSHMWDENLEILRIHTECVSFIHEKYCQFLSEYAGKIKVKTLNTLKASFEDLCSQLNKLTNDRVGLVEDITPTTDRFITLAIGIPKNGTDRAREEIEKFIDSVHN